MSLDRFRTVVALASPDDSVDRAARVMRDRRVGCLVVQDGPHRGIVTDRDLVIRVLARGIDAHAKIGRFVTYDPITVSVHDNVETAARRMQIHGVRRLPLVDDQGEIVGIVTADDLLALIGSEIAGVCAAVENGADSMESR
jgi:CBS domain-containing protein